MFLRPEFFTDLSWTHNKRPLASFLPQRSVRDMETRRLMIRMGRYLDNHINLASLIINKMRGEAARADWTVPQDVGSQYRRD